MRKDFAGSAILLCVAVLYYAASVQIPASSLEDQVGPRALPSILALLLGILALWLEWWLYYSSRERQRTAEIRELPGDDISLHLDREVEDREESESRKTNLVV